MAGNRSGAAAEWRGALGRALLVFGALSLLAVGLLYSQNWLPSSPSSAAQPVSAKIGPSFDRRPNGPRENPPGPRVAGSPAPMTAGAPAKPARPPAALQADSSGLPAAAVVSGPVAALAEPAPSVSAETAPAALAAGTPGRAETPPDEPAPPDAEPVDAAEQPAAGPAKRRAEEGASKRPRRSGSARCTTYRTYDSRTQTYRAYDGTTRSCKPEG